MQKKSYKKASSKFQKYIIVADESVRHGLNYSFFFGGCIVKEDLYENISNELDAYKDKLGLNEIKREKINRINIDSYKKMIDLFFRYIRAGDIKLRIMYCPNNQLNQYPHGQDNIYPKLYHVFILRAFSIFNAYENINLKIFLDELPESLAINKLFKKKLVSAVIREANKIKNSVKLFQKDIIEVDSKKHVILQCVDVVLGVIEFYLNNKQADKDLSVRGKAKMDLFIHIFDNYISKLCPSFDFTQSTGKFKCAKAWNSPYKHFVFKKAIKKPQT